MQYEICQRLFIWREEGSAAVRSFARFLKVEKGNSLMRSMRWCAIWASYDGIGLIVGQLHHCLRHNGGIIILLRIWDKVQNKIEINETLLNNLFKYFIWNLYCRLRKPFGIYHVRPSIGVWSRQLRSTHISSWHLCKQNLIEFQKSIFFPLFCWETESIDRIYLNINGPSAIVQAPTIRAGHLICCKDGIGLLRIKSNRKITVELGVQLSQCICRVYSQQQRVVNVLCNVYMCMHIYSSCGHIANWVATVEQMQK